MSAGMITAKDIPLIERKMGEKMNYKLLNAHFTEQRGQRWANRLQAFAKWLWANREAILQILGIVIMFAEDGTPTVKDANELDGETVKQARANLSQKKPMKTPHGEKVEDFTEEKPKPKRKRKSKPKVEKMDSETALDTLTAEAQEQGFYDLGLSENPLHKEEKNDEVQSGEASSEATDRLKSDELQ
jgi:hypothetical protein